MKRICVVGTTGSGKTWLAGQLAARLNLRFIDLDDLHWNPGWREATDEEFRRRIAAVKQAAGQSGHGWVMAGNYSKVADLARADADTIIWLDYAPWAVLPALLRRQLDGIRNRTPRCNGNIETWRQTFSRDSLILWFFKTGFRSSTRFLPLYTSPMTAGKPIIRLRSRAETARFLEGL